MSSGRPDRSARRDPRPVWSGVRVGGLIVRVGGLIVRVGGVGVTSTPPRPSTIWAIVPLRGLASAKTRLGPALDADARLQVVTSMAHQTLRATRDARRLAGTVLVTADPAAAELALGYGARTLVQRLPGLNAALREARAEAIRAGADATIIIPIDLPRIDADGIDHLLDAIVPVSVHGRSDADADADADAGDGPIVALVPDRHGLGTNVLFTFPPEVIDPAFGAGSLASHRAAARAAGARLLELGGPLVLDVDTGDDLLVAEDVVADGSRGPADAA